MSLAIGLGVLPVAAGAQTVDAGAFVVLLGGAVVGEEEFTVRRAPGAGYTVTTTAWYSAARSGITLTAALELGPDSAPTALQFDVTGPDARRVFAVFGPRRITVRSVRPRGEAAREYPPAPRILVLDDSVFALQALPSRAGGEVAFLEPRQDRRGTGTAIWTGPDRTLIGGVAHTLDRLALSRASGIRHLWFDAAGRLMKVEDLATGLVAERQQGPR